MTSSTPGMSNSTSSPTANISMNTNQGRLARTIRGGTQQRVPEIALRQGTVTAAGTTTCTVTIGGDSTEVDECRFLAWYVPTVGDSVWIIINGFDTIVLGKLAGA